MLPRRIGIASRVAAIDLREILRVAAAINLQVARDFQPIWNIAATVTALADPDAIEPGVWPIFVVQDTEEAGAAGLHLTDHQQPFALVEAGPTWSLTASHECLEMLVDPSGNWLVSSAGIGIVNGDVQDLSGAKFEYLVEVADPSEDPANAYMVDDVLVSDFYTPRFFDPTLASGVRYSFTGKVTRPRQILPGGYISWLNPKLGIMQQLRRFGGGPEIVDLPGTPAASGRKTLRGFVDEQTKPPMNLARLPSNSAAVAQKVERTIWLQTASALRSSAFALALHPHGVVEAPESPDEAQAALNANVAQLRVARATMAYVGWHFENDWITRKRAIVVLARAEDVQAVQNQVPSEIAGIPVDVRADPRPTIAGPGGTALLITAAAGAVRPEYAVPEFPGQIDFENSIQSPILAARASKPRVKYEPPSGVTLAPITAQMTLILHASPEQGWAQLQNFLKNVNKELVVGIYEFTAPHIEKALVRGLKSPDKLTLTLDSPPEPKGKREQTVEDTEQGLRKALKKRMTFAWALAGQGHDAPAMAFPTSYHIKVAVKDSRSFWLSSGNWNTSNQPDIDPADRSALQEAIRNNDRDWHVICDCPSLAKVFRAYLLKDNETAIAAAAAQGAAAALAAAPVQVDLDMPEWALAARDARTFFDAHTVRASIKVKPLLTPDDYRKPILELLKSAQKRIYMQTQYIHTVDPQKDTGEPTHMELIAALAEQINAGLDVRLITSEYQNKQWIESLQDAGVDTVEHLRIQKNVHNKGIVVDSETVVVSSQNWSADGTGPNRDAGLIIYNAEAAKYFESIFLHDWINLAVQKSAN